MEGVFEKRDPAFDRIIGDNPRLDHLATGFGFAEGPVWRGDHLLFSDIPNSRIVRYELAEEGPRVATFRYPSGNSNGMTLDRERRLVTCEHTHRRVTRTGSDGRLTVVANRYDGRRFNSPNDVVVKSDGSVYFTDPPFGLAGQAQGKEQEVNGVYRVSPDGSEVALVVSDMERPNGLAFSPDERLLYVDDSARRHILAFDVESDGSLSGSRVFAVLESDEAGVPDGMKLDVEGNVYCTGPGGVWVLDPSARVLGRIMPPEIPANCAWGDSDLRGLYLTARTGLYRVRLAIAGIKAGG